jgi:hypothetical protein
MKLYEALKVSLDELRMQMLGAQVLLGFQFQGLFQDRFSELTSGARIVAAVGLGLMVVTIALIIAVPCQHRLVERGEATQRIYLQSKRYAELALLPMAAGIGCALLVAMGLSFGWAVSVLLSAALFVTAIGLWYVLGLLLRRRWAVRPSGAPMKTSDTPLHDKIEQMLTEGRVILPGVQALLGFQFVVMLSKSFGELPPAARILHVVALTSLALTITLLIAPAAVHRITFEGNDDPRLHSLGTTLMTVALLPLICGISCDLWVALTRLFGEGIAPTAGALSAAVLLVGLWYVLPLFLRRGAHGPRGRATATPS